jgi:hypothetical protein
VSVHIEVVTQATMDFDLREDFATTLKCGHKRRRCVLLRPW